MLDLGLGICPLQQQRLSTLCQAQLARSRDIFCHTMTSREHTGLGPVVYNIKLLCTDRRCVCRPVFDMLHHLPGIHDTSHLLFLANLNILFFFLQVLFFAANCKRYSSSRSTNRSCVYWRSWSLLGGSSAGRGFAACICSSTSHRPSSLELAIRQHQQHQQLLMQDDFSGTYWVSQIIERLCYRKFRRSVRFSCEARAPWAALDVGLISPRKIDLTALFLARFAKCMGFLTSCWKSVSA